MPSQITSAQNARIKGVIKLAKRSQRRQRQMTVVEGEREVARALACGVVPVEAYICADLALSESARALTHSLLSLDTQHDTLVSFVTRDVYAKLAYRADSGGILLVVPYTAHTLDKLAFSAAPFLIAIEGVEKPGNLGAILRTADAAGADGVIVCSGATDIHNPNVIRASLGAFFSVPVIETTTAQATAWMSERQIKIVATSPTATERYTNTDLIGPVAIALGSEAAGLSQTWLEAADTQVYIPMLGTVDSLNLSTSAALLLYEVLRQRDG